MLVIKSPLAIRTIGPFGSYTDILGEKIRTGYRLAAANITAEDLFHMIMQRQDIYIGMEDNGIYHSILQVRNQMQADASLKLELVNQLINRIMLYQTPRFTYQDEVFVASMLQKLGITDTAGFMQEIVRQMDRNRLLIALTDKYFGYGREIAHVVDNTITNHKLAENRFRSDRYLHNGIFKRLLTAECNNILYCYRNQVQATNVAPVSVHDVTWMEQADVIQLSQLRENMFYQTNSAFWQAFNAYEAMPLEQNEWTEKKIMQRMAMAVFENILQKIHYGRQYCYRDGEAVWQEYTSILYQGAADAADVIERFRDYQDGKNMYVREIETYGNGMCALIWDELQLAELLVHLDTDADMDDESGALYADMRNSVIVSILENQNFQKQLSEKIRIRERGQNRTEQMKRYAEDEADYVNELRMFQKTYKELRETTAQRRPDMEKITDIELLTVTDITEEAVKKICGQLQKYQDAEVLYLSGMEKASYYSGNENTMAYNVNVTKGTDRQGTMIQNAGIQHADLYNRIDEQYITYLTEITDEQESVSHENVSDRIDEKEIRNQSIVQVHADKSADVDGNQFYQDAYIEQFLNRYADILGEHDIPLMENERLLERMNAHNLSMKQLLDKTLQESDTDVIIKAADGSPFDSGAVWNGSERVSVDLVQARRNALRVLENPHAVLEEIYENAPGVRKSIPKEVERILSIVDEQTKFFYEQLLGYRENTDIRQPAWEDSQQLDMKEYGNVWNDNRDSQQLDMKEYGNVWNDNRDSLQSDMEEYGNVWNDNRDSLQLDMEEYGNAWNDNRDSLQLDMEEYGNVWNDNRDIWQLDMESNRKDIAKTAHGNEREIPDDQKFRTASDSKGTQGQTAEKYQELLRIQGNIYALLRRIEQTEERMSWEAADMIGIAGTAGLSDVRTGTDSDAPDSTGTDSNVPDSTGTDSNVPDSTGTDRLEIWTAKEYVLDKARSAISPPDILQLPLTHKTDNGLGGEALDEIWEAICNIKPSIKEQDPDRKSSSHIMNIMDTQVWQNQLQDMKRELIAQGEEQLARVVERSLKTHAHTISDKVYLELERRLRNEQRRRGC